MSDLHKAAKQALERLRKYHHGNGFVEDAECIAALEATLAQKAEPVQEPVAWIQPDHLQKARIAPFLCRVEPTQRCADFVPLYLAPPQRKPLTSDKDRPDQGATYVEGYGYVDTRAVRAIERAHGIGETK